MEMDLSNKSPKRYSESNPDPLPSVDRLSAELEASSLEQKQPSSDLTYLQPSSKQIQEAQNARSLLRERYLYLLSSLCQNQTEVEVQMYEDTNVSGNMKAIDRVFDYMVIENLKAPFPSPDVPVPKAVLRTNDIISIEFEHDKCLNIPTLK